MKFAVRAVLSAASFSWTLFAQQSLTLDLKDAIALAIRPDAQSRMSDATIERQLAAAGVARARSSTAWMIEGSVSESVVRFDLRALGIDFPQVSPFVANVSLPAVVGPFSVADGRIVAGKSLIDRAAAGRVRAAIGGEESARVGEAKAREQIAAATSKAYFAAALAQSNVELNLLREKAAARLLTFETERKARGLVTGADVRRASAELAIKQRELSAARSEQFAALLKLKDLLGVDFGQEVQLLQRFDSAGNIPTVEQALVTAFQSRPEIVRAELQLKALGLSEKAIDAEKLPTLTAFGNFGALTTAPTPNRTQSTSISHTYAAGLALRVPLFDGGRRADERKEVDAKKLELQASLRQLRRQTELEIRLALERVRAAGEQLALVTVQWKLADEDLRQARGRFNAGEASVLEVSQAQTRMDEIDYQRLDVAYQHNLARLAVGEAMGTVAAMNW
ncbi:MAG: TolC family protein [Bryobacteraceae bacterium]